MFSIRIDPEKCTGQAVCIAVCPETVFNATLDQNLKPIILDREACTGCGACVRGCPDDAIVVINEETGEEISE